MGSPYRKAVKACVYGSAPTGLLCQAACSNITTVSTVLPLHPFEMDSIGVLLLHYIGSFSSSVDLALHILHVCFVHVKLAVDDLNISGVSHRTAS